MIKCAKEDYHEYYVGLLSIHCVTALKQSFSFVI